MFARAVRPEKTPAGMTLSVFKYIESVVSAETGELMISRAKVSAPTCELGECSDREGAD